MIKKKKHHYIPKFYLKRFSVNNEAKFIGLYNLKNNLFIQEAPLRHQACQNFLYGEDDEIENILADIEDKVSRMFYYWTEEKLLFPPPIDSNGFKLLKRFILYQAFRTLKSGNVITDIVNKGLKSILKEFDKVLWDKVKDENIVHRNPVLLSLLHSAKYEHLLNFLDFKFIVNLSQLPLITSDAPVIFYNQLMEKAGNYAGATGLIAKGLQIFYPIHPRLLICIYDPEVYVCGSQTKNCTSTDQMNDIHQLNALQFINCDSQMFFDNNISHLYIQGLLKKFGYYRNSDKHRSEIFRSNDSIYLFSISEEAHINLNLSFFKINVELEPYKNRAVPLRNISFENDLYKRTKL